MADYIYSVANDTLNGAVDIGALNEQIISEPLITISLAGITVQDDVLTVTFNATLSAPDEAALVATVAAHTGDPIVEPVQTWTVDLSTKTPSGLNEVAITKPDGVSKTYISHNFCDDSTWPAANDSVWEFKPTELMRVYRAEVQFTHDVVEPYNTNPAKIMHLDIMYQHPQLGLIALPDDSKVFNNIYDVFDLGNKHYSMQSDALSMGGGITTVQFDYTDVITIDPAFNMSMKFYLNADSAFQGTHCSVSLVAGPAVFG